MLGLMERTEVALVENPDVGNSLPVRKAITSGYFCNAARISMSGDSYKTIKASSQVYIHPSSTLAGDAKPRWVCYHEHVLTSKEFMRNVIEIHPDWLHEVAPHYYTTSELKDDALKKMPRKQGRAQINND